MFSLVFFILKSDDIMIVQFTFIVVVIVFLYNYFRKPDGLPPGKWGLPIIGKLPSRGKGFHDLINNMHEKHGDVFCIKMGVQISVFLCDFNLIKDTFSKTEFTGREAFYTLSYFTNSQNLGLVFSSGDVWKNGRRFALSHLKDFGLGTSRMEVIISEEVEAITNYLDTKLDKPVEVDFVLNVAVLNVVWNLIAARRFDLNDGKIVKFSEMLNQSLRVVDGPLALINLFPWLKYLPQIVKDKVLGEETLYTLREEIQGFIKKIILQHQEEQDVNHPKDYLDTYLTEIQKGENDIFTFNNLVASITDLFNAGSETTSSSLRWFLIFMAAHQEVQDKAYQDICNVVPKDRFPSLDDKSRLPYVDAVNHEIMRRVSLVPFSLPHQATQDTYIKGFKIPKGTLVNACSQICHYSDRYWKKPNQFYPEHFLNDEGKFILPKEGFLPFSIGKRYCPGESVAKMEIFLFTSALIQRYKILPPEGVTMSLKVSDDANVLNLVPPFKIMLKKR